MKKLIFIVLLLPLTLLCKSQSASIPSGFINQSGNKMVEKSGIYTDGLTVPHGTRDTLYSHPPKDGSIFWNTTTRKLKVYDSASRTFITIQGDSVSTTNGALSLYRTVFVNTKKNTVPIYTYGYTAINTSTATPMGSGILSSTTRGDTTYVRYSSPPAKDSIHYVFTITASSATQQIQGGGGNGTAAIAEYVGYATTNYTVDYTNGLVQNIVFDLSSSASLTLPTPITNMTVHVSNMSVFALTSNLNLYNSDTDFITDITSRKCEIVWSVAKQKWYLLQD